LSTFRGPLQASNSWETQPPIDGWTYGEDAAEPSGSASHGEPTFAYYADEACAQEVTDIASAGAGTYWMRTTVVETANYAGLSAVVEFTVAQATVTVSTEDRTVYYNGSPQQAAPVTATGTDDYEVLYGLSEGEYDLGESPSFTDPGTYTVYFVVTASDNYALTTQSELAGSYTFAILPVDDPKPEPDDPEPDDPEPDEPAEPADDEPDDPQEPAVAKPSVDEPEETPAKAPSAPCAPSPHPSREGHVPPDAPRQPQRPPRVSPRQATPPPSCSPPTQRPPSQRLPSPFSVARSSAAGTRASRRRQKHRRILPLRDR